MSDKDALAAITPPSSLGRLRDEARLLETLNRVGQAVAAELDLERVVQIVTDAGTELSGAAFGSFFYIRRDDKGEAYWLYTISGVPRENFAQFPMPRNTAVFAPTFRGDSVVRSDEFLATLAHELRNPLAPIRNAVQILKLKESDPVASASARQLSSASSSSLCDSSTTCWMYRASHKVAWSCGGRMASVSGSRSCAGSSSCTVAQSPRTVRG